MTVETEFRSGYLVIRLAGELDHHEAKSLWRELENVMDRYLPTDCALDLSGVSFMDSSGIAILLRLYKRLQATGGRVCVLDPPIQPGKVLAAAGLERLIPTKHTREVIK